MPISGLLIGIFLFAIYLFLLSKQRKKPRHALAVERFSSQLIKKSEKMQEVTDYFQEQGFTTPLHFRFLEQPELSYFLQVQRNFACYLLLPLQGEGAESLFFTIYQDGMAELTGNVDFALLSLRKSPSIFREILSATPEEIYQRCVQKCKNRANQGVPPQHASVDGWFKEIGRLVDECDQLEIARLSQK